MLNKLGNAKSCPSLGNLQEEDLTHGEGRRSQPVHEEALNSEGWEGKGRERRGEGRRGEEGEERGRIRGGGGETGGEAR